MGIGGMASGDEVPKDADGCRNIRDIYPFPSVHHFRMEVCDIGLGDDRGIRSGCSQMVTTFWREKGPKGPF